MFDHADTLAARKGKDALVMGGSMAGMLAARVLADHFERVTIIERDRFPERPEPRRGVHQGHHLHVLLKRGRISLERLFPGPRDQHALRAPAPGP